MNDAIALIWAYYGHVAEAIYELITRLAPKADFVAFMVAALWPFLIVMAVLFTIISIHDRIIMRRIRRDIARRTGSASILRDRSN